MSLAGQIEIFLPVDEIGSQVSKIVDDCLSQYGEKYPGIDLQDDVYYDFNLLYTLGEDVYKRQSKCMPGCNQRGYSYG